jgi:hypothetical protein
MARHCVTQVLDLLDGRTPDGVVNPEVLSQLSGVASLHAQ